MGEGFPFGDIIIIAAVAAFVILRYRSVIGQKKGYDFSQEPRAQKDGRADEERIVQLDVKSKNKQIQKNQEEIKEKNEEEGLSLEAFSAQIAQIKSIDPAFKAADFLHGAKMAFEMVVQAYNENDTETLERLLGQEVYGEFKQALDAQENQGISKETTLVSIARTTIEDITIKNMQASIEVGFVSEQILLERDDKGEIISGDPSRVENIEDVWVYEKDLRSRDPNWKIVST